MKEKKSNNELDYLKSIKIKTQVTKLSRSNISECQMTLKTNQFNLTTKRYSEDDLLKLNNNKKNIIKLISLKDIYGDHGIVGGCT